MTRKKILYIGFWMKPKRDEAPELGNEERDIVGIFRTFANGENEASPKQDFLAYELGCSVRSIQRYLDGLIKKGWIKKTQRGLKLPNKYTFQTKEKDDVESEELDTTECHIQTRQNVISRHDRMSLLDTTPVSPLDTTPVSCPTLDKRILDKDIQVIPAEGSAIIPKKENGKGQKQPIQEVFDLFHELTGWIPQFQNKTERKAGEDLLKFHSFDELREMLVFARSIKNEDYVPKVSTPYDMSQKWGKLVDEREKRATKTSSVDSLIAHALSLTVNSPEWENVWPKLKQNGIKATLDRDPAFYVFGEWRVQGASGPVRWSEGLNGHLNLQKL